MSELPMTVPPKAIIFDYGQVLSQRQNPEAVRAMLELSGLDPQTFQRRYWAHRLQFDRGALRAREYWQAILGCDELEPQRLERILEADVRGWTDTNEPVLRWALSLPPRGIRIALLSNMPAEILEGMRRRLRWLARFEVQVYSCDVGAVKPEPRIFERCLEALGAGPGEVFFIDDNEENVAAARRIGIPAVCYRLGVTSIAELARCAGLPEEPPPRPAG